MDSLAVVYRDEGKFAQAEALCGKALAGRRRALGAEHPDTLDTMADLALVQHAQGKFAAGEALARELVLADRKMRPETWQRFFAESLLGAHLAGEKKLAEAEPLLLEGQRVMETRRQMIASSRLERARQGAGQGLVRFSLRTRASEDPHAGDEPRPEPHVGARAPPIARRVDLARLLIDEDDVGRRRPRRDRRRPTNGGMGRNWAGRGAVRGEAGGGMGRPARRAVVWRSRVIARRYFRRYVASMMGFHTWPPSTDTSMLNSSTPSAGNRNV